MTSKNLIPMPLNPRDYDKVARLATAQRRRPTDILKNLLLDLDSGIIPLPAPPPIEEKPKRHSMCVRADDVLKSKADALKERAHMSLEKIVHLALQTIPEPAPPERIDGLKNADPQRAEETCSTKWSLRRNLQSTPCQTYPLAQNLTR